ncbi:hypothetical protein SDC9_131517 [bioreactor metagenome]|uniref:Uncharacterized protein n=1 Tax=bioreactor metagenome TaxID=1076179 RepID=A0A645D5F0_9ZZZZ
MAGEPGRCRMAAGSRGGRHRRRRGRRYRLCAPDAYSLLHAGHSGGYRLHGPGCLYYGPDFPPVRPLGQELHPHADFLRLRRARHHGQPHHRKRAGPPHDRHDHHLHPLRRENADYRPVCRRFFRRLRLDRHLGLLYRRGLHHHFGHYPEENQDVCRRSGPLCNGAAPLPCSFRLQRAAQHLGAGLELH